MAEMSRAVWTLAMAGPRQRYPDDTPALRRRRLADLLLSSNLRWEHIEPLIQSLGDAFYAGLEMMRNAIRQRAPQPLIVL
ncbi:MAG: hypothetical protein N0A15_07185 [Anaerolineae bacterium]|nr:hypothetical protein [Anaerolineae bacterium]